MSHRFSYYRSLITFALFSGLASVCTTLTNTSMMPWHIDDPAHLSPDIQSLDNSANQQGRAGNQPASDHSAAATVPDAIPQIDRETNETGGKTGPELDPRQSVRAEIDLQIEVADRTQVGSRATFNITVRNLTDQSVENVIVEADLDRPLVFPGHREKRIRRTLGTIAPRASREFKVMLTSEQQGTHCARFTVTVAGEEAAWKEVCVKYVVRELEVSIVSPQERTVGSRAEFTVKLLNRAARKLTDVRVVVTYDDALEPRESSTGAVFEKRSLLWNLGDVKPGEGVQLQIEFECLAAAERACVSVDVSGEYLADERVSKCLRVVRQSGLLHMELRDTRDPITVGEQTEHVITVRNRAPQTLHEIRLTAVIPDSLRVLSTTVMQGQRQLRVETTADGGQIVFAPIANLPAGATLTFRIETKALRAGDLTFTVRASHALSREPVSVSEPLSVNAD